MNQAVLNRARTITAFAKDHPSHGELVQLVTKIIEDKAGKPDAPTGSTPPTRGDG